MTDFQNSNFMTFLRSISLRRYRMSPCGNLLCKINHDSNNRPMKKVSIMLSLMLGLSAVSLSSCSDSDDDNIITPGSVENIDPAKVFPLGLPAKVNGMPVTTDAEGRVTAIGNMVTFDYNSYIPGRADRSYDVLMKVADGSEIYLSLIHI